MSVGNAGRLTVKCPSCGKTGKLPQGVTTYPKNVKCSGCQTRFNPVQDSAPKFREWESPVYEVVPSVPVQAPVKRDPIPPLGVSESEPVESLDRPSRQQSSKRLYALAAVLLPLALGGVGLFYSALIAKVSNQQPQKLKDGVSVTAQVAALQNATTLQCPYLGTDKDKLSKKLREWAENPFEFRRVQDQIFKTTFTVIKPDPDKAKIGIINGDNVMIDAGTYDFNSGKCATTLFLWYNLACFDGAKAEPNLLDLCALTGNFKLSESEAEQWRTAAKTHDQTFTLTVWYRLSAVLKAEFREQKYYDQFVSERTRVRHEMSFAMDVLHHEVESKSAVEKK